MTASVQAGLEDLRRKADHHDVQQVRADIIYGDRRSGLRCQASLDLRYYCSKSNGCTSFGRGTTVDLSRSGIRFSSEGPVPPLGAVLELRIDWPIKLQGTCPVELLVCGPLVRIDDTGLTVAVDTYEFRTAKEKSFDALDLPPTTYSLTA